MSEGQKPLTSEDAKEEEEGRPHHSVISLVIHQSQTWFRTTPTLDWGTREMFPRKGITMSMKLETIVLSIWPTNMCGWNSWPRPGLKCKVQACQATTHWQEGKWQLERGGAGMHTCAICILSSKWSTHFRGSQFFMLLSLPTISNCKPVFSDFKQQENVSQTWWVKINLLTNNACKQAACMMICTSCEIYIQIII